MLKKINEIAEGWFNVTKDKLGILDPKIRIMAERRLQICNNCPVRDAGTCSEKRIGTHVRTGISRSGCGCPLIAKSKSPTSFCPLGKW